ncbi:hypothetical protein D6D01_09806 [Aureobasidium pullulans]|uniref:Uncharacterized protein n=1 Tax=Aureobasidium pullulans TaxID=5580 RepID=A0A4S9JVQ5_AURPU|nr:hypothetical protein D6D01_09806 [Aureobasidium pullulans]
MDRKEPWPPASPIWNGEEVRDLLVEGNEMIQLRCKPEEQQTDDPTHPESPPFSANIHKRLLCNFSDHYRAIFPPGVSESGSPETQLDLPSRLARTFVL